MLHALSSVSDSMSYAIHTGAIVAVGENTPNQEQVTHADLQLLETMGHVWVVTIRTRVTYFVTQKTYARYVSTPSTLRMGARS